MPRYSNRQLAKTIRYLHGLGQSDGDIAIGLFERRGIVVSRNRIRRFRLRYGLKTNFWNDVHRAKMGELRRLEEIQSRISFGRRVKINNCLESIRLGWSHPLTVMERMICECLIDGPKNVNEIRLLLDRRTRPSEMLTRMCRDGLLIRRKVSRYVWEYSLARGVSKANRE